MDYYVNAAGRLDAGHLVGPLGPIYTEDAYQQARRLKYGEAWGPQLRYGQAWEICRQD